MLMSPAGFLSIAELSGIVPLVELPAEDLPEVEERRARRFEPVAPVEVVLTHADGREQVGLLADVSSQGARIIADESPRGGEIVELALQIGRARKPLAEGFVIHTDDSDLGCFGVDFAHLPPVAETDTNRQQQVAAVAI